MTAVFQLYGRPLAENTPLPPLRITGDLEGYTAGEPYEGRLQIIDSIGKCVVEIVESSLPPGSYAFVDNFTKEIVLRWPAYAPPDAMASGVPNGDFEQGDDGSWRLGAGWSIEAGGAETGTYSAVYQNQRGVQSIESAPVPYTPGQVINASVRFQQGASSEDNLVGRILLVWYDANGRGIPGGEGIAWIGGNLIRSGSGGEWKTSAVTGSSNHPNVAQVAVGFSANRKKQNHLARVDNFTWDHEYAVGTVSDLDFTVTFKVTDSANRVAYWAGVVGEYALFFTSRPYTVEMPAEGMGFANAQVTAGFLKEPPNYDDGLPEHMTASATITTGEMRDIVQTYTYYQPEHMTAGATLLSGTLKSIVIPYTYYQPEHMTAGATLLSGTMKVVLVPYTNGVPEHMTASATIIGGTLS